MTRGGPTLPPGSRAGELLREARESAGMRQGELASRCGTAQSAVSRIERGHISPTVETLERLVRATGARLDMSIIHREET